MWEALLTNERKGKENTNSLPVDVIGGPFKVWIESKLTSGLWFYLQ